MIKTTAISLAAALLIAGVSFAQQTAPSLLAQAVSQTQAQKRAYAFDYDMQAVTTVAGATNSPVPPVSWRAHYDPAGTAPHLHLIDPQHLEGLGQQTFSASAQKMQGLGWCASVEMGRAQNVQLVREDATSAVYSFQPSAEAAGHGVPAQRLRGEITILKANPDVSDIHIVLTQPFNPNLISTVNALSLTVHCETAANARRYASNTVTDFTFSALGHTITEHSVTHTTNLSTVP